MIYGRYGLIPFDDLKLINHIGTGAGGNITGPSLPLPDFVVCEILSHHFTSAGPARTTASVLQCSTDALCPCLERGGPVPTAEAARSSTRRDGNIPAVPTPAGGAGVSRNDF